MIPVSPEFAKALNDMMRKDLDGWSAYWFWVLIASTIVVVIGLLAELPEVWSEVLRPAWAWARNFWNAKIRIEDFGGWARFCPELRRVPTTELSERWKVFVGATALFGWILVAVGVAGEGTAEYFVNDAETNLRNLDKAVLIETQNSATSAASAASLANELADTAGVKAKVAGIGADEAQKKVAAVAKRAEQLNAELGAEKERHEPRHVTPAQRACMQVALKGLSGQRLKMVEYRASPEQVSYTHEIAGVLEPITRPDGSNGIDVETEEEFPDRTGILLEYGTKESSDAVCKALRCLIPRGTENVRCTGPDDPNQEMTFFVFPDTSRRAPPR